MNNFTRHLDTKKALGLGIKESNKDAETLYKNMMFFFKNELQIKMAAGQTVVNFGGAGFYINLILKNDSNFHKNSHQRKKFREWFKCNTIWEIFKIENGDNGFQFLYPSDDNLYEVVTFRITLREIF